MRNDYLKAASAIIREPNILINVVSRRVKQLRAGSKPMVDSLEKLDMEDVALKEIIEGKIFYELYSSESTLTNNNPAPK
ncbi:MAG: DNA-directed RNA polymerase subunit omega [Puniceicoccales bacterium]|jgi:DNA-directed RNA polymerase subunit omega|nr:DNA-directed RNA polymerase subunit omega [Puniceicoccales bacterium]